MIGKDWLLKEDRRATGEAKTEGTTAMEFTLRSDLTP